MQGAYHYIVPSRYCIQGSGGSLGLRQQRNVVVGIKDYSDPIRIETSGSRCISAIQVEMVGIPLPHILPPSVA